VESNWVCFISLGQNGPRKGKTSLLKYGVANHLWSQPPPIHGRRGKKSKPVAIRDKPANHTLCLKIGFGALTIKRIVHIVGGKDPQKKETEKKKKPPFFVEEEGQPPVFVCVNEGLGYVHGGPQ